MTQPLIEVDVVRVRGNRQEHARDCAAAEAPLEVRLHGSPFAVIMRTPGADLELTAGFLLAERVLNSAADLDTIEHCQDQSDVVNATLDAGAARQVEQALASRRNVVANAACGVCGRLTIDALGRDVPPIAGDLQVAATTVATLPDRLRHAQPLFAATGGLHAAGLFDADGALITAAEDVGRHNAVDKVVGRCLMRDELPLSAVMLFVSGRTSFEIVQKAWLAGIPIVASVSAPSSLAISLARDAGITLVGFVRDPAFNIYSHPGRVTIEGAADTMAAR